MRHAVGAAELLEGRLGPVQDLECFRAMAAQSQDLSKLGANSGHAIASEPGSIML